MQTPINTADDPGNGHTSDAPGRTALMSEFSIGFDGRQYDFGGYRYDRLADAVAYARQMRSRRAPDAAMATAPMPMRDEPLIAPSAADGRLMAALDISFVAGVYHFAGFRYERLNDAATHARLLAARQASDRC